MIWEWPIVGQLPTSALIVLRGQRLQDAAPPDLPGVDRVVWRAVVMGEPGATLLTFKVFSSCESPGGKEQWHLSADLLLRLRRKVRVEFRDIVYMHPHLDDDMTTLWMGHKRGPRTKQDLARIAERCLRPLAEFLLASPREGEEG